MIGHFTTDDGLRLAYDDRGSGHPLLCLAGLSRNMADFDGVAERFAGAARILRLDSRGRGLSEHDPEPANYTIPREARDAVALLDHLGLDSVSILGTSRGGLIAMTLAATDPARLRGVILNDIGPVIDPEGLAHIAGYLGRRPSYADHEDAADRLPMDMAPAFSAVPRATWRAFAAALWREGPDGLELRYDPALREAVLEQAAATQKAPDLWPLFDALSGLPLGLIRGANSNILSAETAAEMRRRRPDMLFAEVPDRGHVPFLNEPQATLLIETYLGRVA